MNKHTDFFNKCIGGNEQRDSFRLEGQSRPHKTSGM